MLIVGPTELVAGKFNSRIFFSLTSNSQFLRFLNGFAHYVSSFMHEHLTFDTLTSKK